MGRSTLALAGFARELRSNAQALLPVVVILAVFQWGVVGEPMQDLAQRVGGMLLILLGLTFLVSGLERSMFPLAESLSQILAERGSTALLFGFAFSVGFGSTFAEPALAAVTSQAAVALASTGAIGSEPETVRQYSLLLRIACAAAVGAGVTIGILRILLGWPAVWLVVGGYALVSLLALVGSGNLTAIAMDAGAAATSAINIPIISALGVGLASMLRGRTALADGFGIVALASLMPMLVILTASHLMGSVGGQ